MKKIINLFCILGMAGLLAACSYFDTGEGVDISSAQPAMTVPADSPVLAPVEYKDVANVIEQSSDGRVQIFPLDGEDRDEANDKPLGVRSSGPVEIQPVDAVPLYNESYREAYPGVEVFPLDDDMAALVNPHIMRYAAPAHEVTPSPLTPFPDEEDKTADVVSLSPPAENNPVAVYFDHDSSALKQEDLALLSDVAHHYGGQDISVAGHASSQSSIADPVRRKIANLKVSMDRAFAVARALIESGVPAEHVEAKGYGETRPPVPGHKPVEVASRRVEITGVSMQ